MVDIEKAQVRTNSLPFLIAAVTAHRTAGHTKRATYAGSTAAEPLIVGAGRGSVVSACIRNL